MYSQFRSLLSNGLLSCLLLAIASPAARSMEPTPASTVNRSASLEQAVVAEINQARTHPQAYANWLAAQRSHYNGTLLSLPGEAPLQTREGVAALDEVIAYLRSAQPVAALNLSAGMSLAADEAIEGSDNSSSEGSLRQRLSHYGTWGGSATELSSSGENTAEAIVMLLILNDGNSDRPFRSAILNSDYQFTGVACGTSPVQRSECILDYAVNYTENRNATQSSARMRPIAPAARPG